MRDIKAQSVARWRRARDRREDDGFGLVEAVVALGLMATILLALLSTSVFALHATTEARRNQQAADYLNGAIEGLRSLSYGSIAMKTSEVASAPRVVAGKFDPGTGLETVHATAGGAVSPAVQTVSSDADANGKTDNGTFTLRRWVTIPAGATLDASGIPSKVRATAEVEWRENNKTRVRKSSTVVTNTRRGLPLPNYTYLYNGPAPIVGGKPTWNKNPGADIDFGMALTNLGARDSWTITASTNGWSYYWDTDHDGIWSEDVATEPAVNPANTGLIEPNGAPVHLVARQETNDGTSLGTYPTAFTARSDAQPSYPVKTFTAVYVIQTGAPVQPTPTPTPTPSPTGPVTLCSPGTDTGVTGLVTAPTLASVPKKYSTISKSLFNGPEVGDTAAKATNAMGSDTSGLQPNACNFSTNLHTVQAGRLVTAAAATTAGKAEWLFQPGNASEDTIAGTAKTDLYVQCTAASAVNVTVRLLKRVAAGTSTLLGEQVVPVACTGSGVTAFTRYTASIVLPDNGSSGGSPNGTVIGSTDRLVLQVVSAADVRLLYGTTDAPARLVMTAK